MAKTKNKKTLKKKKTVDASIPKEPKVPKEPKAPKEPKQKVKFGTLDGKKERISASTRAGLLFPVARIRRKIKGATSKKIGKGAAVYFSAVLEYLTAEVLELAVQSTTAHNKKRISPDSIQKAIRLDLELQTLCSNCNFAEGGWQITEVDYMRAHPDEGPIHYKEKSSVTARSDIIQEKKGKAAALQKEDAMLRNELIKLGEAR